MIGSRGFRLGMEAARRLADIGCCEIAPGLDDSEFARIEQEYGFQFADDHRAFLTAGLPVNTPPIEEEGVDYLHTRPWPEWRDGDPAELRESLEWPFSWFRPAITRGFWPVSWGDRPAAEDEAKQAALERLARIPKMIPIFGHRYLPAGHGTFGHPVLSMYGSDIIYYGTDLVDYIHQEFGGPGLDRDDPRWNPKATVPFWRDFVAPEQHDPAEG